MKLRDYQESSQRTLNNNLLKNEQTAYEDTHCVFCGVEFDRE